VLVEGVKFQRLRYGGGLLAAVHWISTSIVILDNASGVLSISVVISGKEWTIDSRVIHTRPR
jgi:hypothetical protein